MQCAGQWLRPRVGAVAAQRRQRAASWRCAAAPQPTKLQDTGLSSQGPLLYDALALDMDGTLTKAHIDFQDMRRRTGIPVGDLFVAMESWEEPEEVARAMDVILEIEAEAAKGVKPMPGLFELLTTLRDHEVKVALVTRNTTASVDAFFQLIGEEWRGVFDALRTREYRFVKPDKRLLLALAEDLGVRPGHMLMVGDSLEDVECGNAAGTASCLIAGGGNEVPGAAPTAPPPGAVPTISVSSLHELNRILLETRPASDGSECAGDAAEMLGWRARVAGGEEPAAVAAELLDPSRPGAPAPGLDFADWLIGMNALCIASTSFPRMGAAAGGLQACPIGGHTVLHLQCGSGALTKMLASKGLSVCGADSDIAAATRRGLQCFEYSGGAVAAGALESAKARGPFDVVLFYQSAEPSAASDLNIVQLLAPAALSEVRSVLKPDGRLCAEGAGEDVEAARAALSAAGWRVDVIEAGGPGRLRVVAQVPPV